MYSDSKYYGDAASIAEELLTNISEQEQNVMVV